MFIRSAKNFVSLWINVSSGIDSLDNFHHYAADNVLFLATWELFFFFFLLVYYLSGKKKNIMPPAKILP